VDSQRQLLDELMGKNRNLDIGEREKYKRKWDDSDVCPYFICGMCPHELFTNTKSDIGPCEKDHDPKMAEMFRKEPEKVQKSTELRYMRFLESLVSEADRRVDKANMRLSRPLDTETKGPEFLFHKEKFEKLNEKITNLAKEMEKLGEEGKVDESVALMEEMEELKKEKDALEVKIKEKDTWVVESQNRMKVCVICGVYTSTDPEDSRAIRHIQGKQHLGFQQIREAIVELKKKWGLERDKKKGGISESNEDPAKDKESQRVADKEKEKEKRKDKKDKRSRSRDRSRRSRSRDRDRGNRSSRSSRDRDRHKKKKRSRSRERRRRSRSRS